MTSEVKRLQEQLAEKEAAIARVLELAAAWESRGEHDMKYSQSGAVPGGDISEALYDAGTDMVERARHIRVAIAGTARSGNDRGL